MRIARIRLSDKISPLHPRWAAAELGQAYEPGRETGAHPRENQPGDACGYDRNDPVPGEFLHEQISKTRFYRLQRQHRSPQFVVECRFARGAAYPDLSMLILPTRGPVDKIRVLDVSNFAQSPPWNGRSSVTSSVTVHLTARALWVSGSERPHEAGLSDPVLVHSHCSAA